MSFSTMETASQLAHQVEEQVQEKIIQQLNWFIQRGLIEIKRGEAIFTTEADPTNGKYFVRYSSTAELVLKDKEYIEKLEAENRGMKLVIEKLKSVL